MRLLRQLTIGLLMITGFALQVLAAEPEGEAEQTAASEEAREAGEAPSGAQEASADEEEVPAAGEEGVAANDGSFIPSEQISEDLSVSFPVDI